MQDVSVSGLAAEAAPGANSRVGGQGEGRRMIAVERRRLDRLTNPRRPCRAGRNTGAPKSLSRLARMPTNWET